MKIRRKKPYPKFNLGDKVYWRSSSNGHFDLKAGTIVAVLQPLIPAGEYVRRHGLRKGYVTWKLVQKRATFRNYESYLVAVVEINRKEFKDVLKCDGRFYKDFRKPILYWPNPRHLKLDQRDYLPKILLPDE